jgi:hypothetical protein
MLKRISSLFLACVITCGSFSAGAAPYSCRAVFSPTLLQVITDIDQTNNNFLFQGKTSNDFFADLSWNQRRHLRSLLKNTHLGDFATEKQVHALAAELTVLLFGSRETVDRWIFESADANLKKSTVSRINEQLLHQGLNGIWGERYSPARPGFVSAVSRRRALISAGISNAFYGKLKYLSLLVGFLPKAGSQEFPAELMEKIVRDGFDAHAEEARVAMHAQTKVEAFNTFRRMWNTTFITSTTAALLTILVLMVLQESEERVNTVIADIDALGFGINDQVAAAKNEIIEKAYAARESDFIQKFGEKPTAQEKEMELRHIRAILFPKSSQSPVN